jgi:hypothetical protein
MGESQIDTCPGCAADGTLQRRELTPDEAASEARKVKAAGDVTGISRWESRAYTCSTCGHEVVHTRPGGKAGRGTSLSFPMNDAKSVA